MDLAALSKQIQGITKKISTLTEDFPELQTGGIGSLRPRSLLAGIEITPWEGHDNSPKLGELKKILREQERVVFAVTAQMKKGVLIKGELSTREKGVFYYRRHHMRPSIVSFKNICEQNETKLIDSLSKKNYVLLKRILEEISDVHNQCDYHCLTIPIDVPLPNLWTVLRIKNPIAMSFAQAQAIVINQPRLGLKFRCIDAGGVKRTLDWSEFPSPWVNQIVQEYQDEIRRCNKIAYSNYNIQTVLEEEIERLKKIKELGHGHLILAQL